MMSATMDWMMWEREHGCTRKSCRDGSLVGVTGGMTEEKKIITKQQDKNLYLPGVQDDKSAEDCH